MTTTLEPPTLRLGSRQIPVVLPRVRDPRMHLAAVTMSIHILGQVALGFRVSVPQIFAAIATCALIDLVIEFRASGRIVWPASAMLTGSGVALILRVVGTERGDHWTWEGWHIFALVAAGSLATKYLITYRGSHVFNPSNLGLVAAFLLLGGGRIEPLDFWWSPLDGWMVAAYLIIIVGGFAITSRLDLLVMAVAFWVTFATGLGLLAWSGHCMTAGWAPQPVCGTSFWWTVVASPEVAIFLFFMITDPKTIPGGRHARVVFAILIGVMSTLLIAPQTTEFGAKVGLLAGLTLLSPARYAIDRVLGAPPGVSTSMWRRMASTGDSPPAASKLLSRGALGGSALVLAAAAIVIAGGPARTPPATVSAAGIDLAIDPATMPPVAVAGDVADIVAEVGDGSQLALALAENLAVEAEAMAAGDVSMLLAVDMGQRLADVESFIDLAVSDGIRVVTEHHIDSLALRVMGSDGSQAGAALGFDAVGTTEQITYDAAGVEQSRETIPMATTFVMRQGGNRWMIAHDLPLGTP
jgi:hypothetical protein